MTPVRTLLQVLGSLVALVAVCFGATSAAVGAPDGSLVVKVSLESEKVWSSEFHALTYLAEFKNSLSEPLRWHPRSTLSCQSGSTPHFALSVLMESGMCSITPADSPTEAK